jgi:hypothetical protein
MRESALAELPNLSQRDPQRVAGNGEHHRVEVAIADHGLIRHGYQRVVVGGVELDRYGVSGGRDILAQRPMDLRYNSEREGILYGSRRSGLEESAS